MNCNDRSTSRSLEKCHSRDRGTDIEFRKVLSNLSHKPTVKLPVYYVFITFMQCLLNRKDVRLGALDHATTHRDILLNVTIFQPRCERLS